MGNDPLTSAEPAVLTAVKETTFGCPACVDRLALKLVVVSIDQ